ncbi:DUF4815 domain-containing protein, partial [Candidatus Babeliales bacterium]|nr:DUF4815 domain-containing protein [Candidatus Babeliales bacterium]
TASLALHPYNTRNEYLDGCRARLAVVIEPGKAYVRGYEVETVGTLFIPLLKARDINSANNLATYVNIGKYALIDNLWGLPQTDYETVSIRDAVSVSPGTIAGNEIGQCEIKTIEYTSGTIGSTTSQYKTYLFNIKMNSGFTFTDDAKQIGNNGIFTADLVLDANSKANILEANKQEMIFELPYDKIQATSDETYNYKQTFYGTLSGSGTDSLTAPTNSQFDPYNPVDYVMMIRSGTQEGEIIDLSGKINLSGVPIGSSLELDLNALGASYYNADYHIITTLTKNNSFAKSKTLQSGFELIEATPTSTTLLSKVDIYEIEGIYDSGDLGTVPTIADIDIKDKFILDNGQRDGYYDIGKITLKTGEAAPKGQILIKFSYFTHGSGDYFTVGSYSGQVDYEDIPQYESSNGTIYELRDCIDLRPRIDEPLGDGFTSPTNPKVMKPKSSFRSDMTYYLNRKDKLYVDYQGIFEIQNGISSLEPNYPNEVDNTMTLYDISLNAYTNDESDLSISYKDNRRYTMKDIGNIERRVDALENYTTLSLLETDTKNLSIKDPNTGLDKFKSGFFVDNFTDHLIHNLKGESKFDIDLVKGECRPRSIERNVPIIHETVSTLG